MTLIKQIINLIRIQNSTDPYDKGIVTHLSVSPIERAAVIKLHKEWLVGRKITGMECEK